MARRSLPGNSIQPSDIVSLIASNALVPVGVEAEVRYTAMSSGAWFLCTPSSPTRGTAGFWSRISSKSNPRSRPIIELGITMRGCHDPSQLMSTTRPPPAVRETARSGASSTAWSVGSGKAIKLAAMSIECSTLDSHLTWSLQDLQR